MTDTTSQVKRVPRATNRSAAACRMLVGVLLAVSLALSAHAVADPPDHAPPPPRGGAQAKNRKIDHKPQVTCLLYRPARAIDWDEKPLREIIEWLTGLSPTDHKVNVIPNWRELDAAGVDGDTTVTLKMERVSVDQVLRQVFDQVSGPDPVIYVGTGNVLRITSRSHVRRNLVTRTYDVNELMTQTAVRKVQPVLFVGEQRNVATATGTLGGTGATSGSIYIGASLFGYPEDIQDEDEPPTDDELAQQMIDWITTTVEPDTWSVHGGPGTLSIFNGVLTVRNSIDVHALLGGPFVISN